MTSQASPKTRKPLIYGAFSVLLSVSVIGYLFSVVTWQQVVDLMLGMDVRGLAGFVVLSLTMSGLRCWRFLLLLDLSGFRPARFAMFLVVLVRNLCADLLPARIGTLVYVYLVTTRLNVPIAAAGSSFAIAFVFDILALGPMILLAALLIPDTVDVSGMLIAFAALALIIICIAILWALPRCLDLVSRVIRHWTTPDNTRAQTVLRIFDETSDQILLVMKAGIYGRVFLLSILLRIAKYSSLYCLLFALLAPLQYSLQDLDPARIFLGFVVPEFAASMPFSGIAGFGAYEGSWVMIFKLLGFPLEIAQLTALSHHGFTQLYGYTLGCIALLWLWLGGRKPDRSGA